MLDSTDASVLELGLKWSQGKAILNSINLEDGEERFRTVLPLAQRYGAALVVGTIDEDPEHGMAVTRAAQARGRAAELHAPDREVRVPARGHPLRPARLPVRHRATRSTSGAPRRRSRGSGSSRRQFPESKTILGISNVSFGLPEAGREVLNSVFLYHATKAGLDLAIVNTEKIVRYPVDPGGGAAARRGPDLQPRRRPGRRVRRLLQGEGRGAEGPEGARRHAARAPAAVHPRRLEGGARRRPRGRADGRPGAARHHQRPADGRACARSGASSTPTS